MREPHWYAVRPTIRGEFRARADLEDVGIEHFLPTFKRWTLVRRTKGRRRQTEHPLLPGYLFARLHGDLFSLIHDRDRCPHVVRIVSQTDATPRPVFVPDKNILALKHLCDIGHFDQGKRSGDGYVTGDRVLITEGVFAGLTARFKDDKTKPGTVRLILDRMFAGQRDLTVDVEHIQAA